MIDIIRGILWILGIVILAGVIAYMGDRVGHQVGRKRLSLFGIRPRYTSTIVAVGTGMLIAFIVVLGAVIASNSVKNAFFHLNALNTHIAQLEAQQAELTKQTRQSDLVLGVNDLVSPDITIFNQGDPPDVRLKKLHEFLSRVTNDANATYVPRGLRKFVPPADAEDKLKKQAESVDLSAYLTQSKVIAIATSDENQFVGDPLHFTIRFVPDYLRFPAGVPVASFVARGSPTLNIPYLMRTLEEYVTQAALANFMPQPFAQNVQIFGAPSAAELERMLHGNGTYRITARAATNVYPDTGGVPIVVSVSPT